MKSWEIVRQAGEWWLHMETEDAEGQLCNSEMQKMGILKIKWHFTETDISSFHISIRKILSKSLCQLDGALPGRCVHPEPAMASSRSAWQKPQHRCYWSAPAPGLSTSHKNGDASLQQWGSHMSRHLGVPVTSKTSWPTLPLLCPHSACKHPLSPISADCLPSHWGIARHYSMRASQIEQHPLWKHRPFGHTVCPIGLSWLRLHEGRRGHGGPDGQAEH